MKMPPSFRARRITPPAAPKAITVNRKPQKAAHGLVDKHTGERAWASVSAALASTPGLVRHAM